MKQAITNYNMQGIRDLGIGVATGECCQNRVMFKQFLMSGGMQFCQVGYLAEFCVNLTGLD